MKPVLLVVAGFIRLSSIGQEVVTINYEEGKAISISVLSDCDPSDFTVRLPGSPNKIIGKLYRDSSFVTFTPLFSFSNKQLYEVTCGQRVIDSFRPRQFATGATKIRSVFPTQDTLPENLLKMHIEFSQPMGRGTSYGHIEIRENGKVIEPFLELESELWNQDYTVFTLWLDPGRIKRDLTPNQLYGNPLTEGKTYELTIKRTWVDQTGSELAADFRKEFAVDARDESLPNVSAWTILPMEKSVVVHFHEPLDYLLIQHSLALWKGNTLLATTVERINNMGIKLVLNGALKKGVYTIKINSQLEDLAGNNLTRPFDRDLTKPVEAQPLQVTFVVD